MNLKAKKILIGMITFVFLFASAYVAQAMGMGGFGGAGMAGAQMGWHSGYSGQMGYGYNSMGRYANMGRHSGYSRQMGYGHNSNMRGSANMGSQEGGYGSTGSHYCWSYSGGGRN